MTDIHLFAIIPLLVLLVCSMIWYGRALLHITGAGYCAVLGYVAIEGGWEFMFFPLLAGTSIIFILLTVYALIKGDWL